MNGGEKNSWRALGKTSSFCSNLEQIGKHCFLKIKGLPGQRAAKPSGRAAPTLPVADNCRREDKTAHSEESGHWWYLKFNWTCRNLVNTL